MSPARIGSLDFRAMPKMELHAHLTGSISRRCLHEIWARKKALGVPMKLEDPLRLMGGKLNRYDINTFFPLFSSYIYHLVDDAYSLDYSTRSVVADFANDGVVYLELRTTPRALPRAGLDRAGYVEAVLDAMDAAQLEHPSIHTRLILSIDRRNSVEDAFTVVSIARRFQARGVVAIDLCGDPTKGDVSLFTQPIDEAKAAGLRITIHFAETKSSASERELQTIMSWEPDRLGHVIHVPQHLKRQIAATKGIGLELCLTCNVRAGMVVGGFEDHHFGEWWRLDGPVVVPGTDDVGVFGSPLSNEWELIQRSFRIHDDELLALVRKGVDVIFGSEEDKARLRQLLW